MSTLISRRLAGVFALVLLAACDSTSTAPSQVSLVPGANATIDGELIRGVDEFPNDLTDRTVSLGCEDGSESEVVRLRGFIIERYTHIQLPTGTVITRHEARPDGLWGVGLTSGDEYDVINRLNRRDIYADRGIIGTSREEWTLQNRRTRALFTLTYAVRYAMDADRNLIAHREQEHSACRGI